MRLTFLGATKTVTGSKYLLEHGSQKILIDCGLFQGLKELRLRNWAKFPLPASSIDAVILTHAHIDHSGYIPRLVKEGFKGKIYCTPATRDLCKILLPDTGHLQEEESRYANRKGYSKHHPALPLFTIDDAYESLKYFRPIDYKTEFSLSNGLKIQFRNAGHILGSANVTIWDGHKSICFSGDIGRINDPVLIPAELPHHVDYLVMESTYGNRIHPQSNPEDELAEIINKTLARKGTLVIPAFTVGRTQTLMYYISLLRHKGRIPFVPVYLNSPMAINVTGIFEEYKDQHRLSLHECHDLCTLATYVNSVEESIRLNGNTEPKIIISASGMATGGRVIHHIASFGSNPNNTLLFSGFQAVGTRGEKIVNGAKTVKIHGEQISIRAEVLNIMSLSAHADKNELITWLSMMKKSPKKIFITHGEPEASAVLKEEIDNRLSWPCVVPEYLSEYEL